MAYETDGVICNGVQTLPLRWLQARATRAFGPLDDKIDIDSSIRHPGYTPKWGELRERDWKTVCLDAEQAKLFLDSFLPDVYCYLNYVQFLDDERHQLTVSLGLAD